MNIIGKPSPRLLLVCVSLLHSAAVVLAAGPAFAQATSPFEQAVSGAAGSWQFFPFEIPAGTASFVVELSGGTGDGDLYLRPSEQPTLDDFACRPFVDGNNETCSTPTPQPGAWIVGVNGFTDFSATLKATWTATPADPAPPVEQPPTEPPPTEPPPAMPPPAMPPPTDVVALRQLCLDTINNFRAMRDDAAALTPAGPELAACSDRGAQSDALSGNAHESFGSCSEFGALGQNSCPGYPVGEGGFATVADALVGCLGQMWAEGTPPVPRDQCSGDCFLMHGHWLNMSNPANKIVACSFAQRPDGTWWMNQDFAQ